MSECVRPAGARGLDPTVGAPPFSAKRSKTPSSSAGVFTDRSRSPSPFTARCGSRRAGCRLTGSCCRTCRRASPATSSAYSRATPSSTCAGQLRHHFGPFLAVFFPAPCSALLRAHAESSGAGGALQSDGMPDSRVQVRGAGRQDGPHRQPDGADRPAGRAGAVFLTRACV